MLKICILCQYLFFLLNILSFLFLSCGKNGHFGSRNFDIVDIMGTDIFGTVDIMGIVILEMDIVGVDILGIDIPASTFKY